MKRNTLLTAVVVALVMGAVSCDPRPVTTTALPTPASDSPTAASPRETQMPTMTPFSSPAETLTPTPTLTSLATPTPGGPVWQILFRGAPCSEMLNPGCQPFDDTLFYLYLINSDGTGLERVEGVPAGSHLAQLSPNAACLAYTGPANGLYLAQADGANPTRILDSVVSFDFSPDGDHLYYASQEVIDDNPGHFEMQGRIGRIRTDGSQNSILATLPAINGVRTRLSPDGEWILAWGESKETVGEHLVYLVATGDGIVHYLLEANPIGSACWSVDGTAVQFIEWRREAGSCVNAFNIVGRDDHSLRSTFTVGDINTCLAWGDWSPDRQEFAFAVHPDSDKSQGGLWVLNLQGGHRYNILPTYYVSFVGIWTVGSRWD